MMKVKFRRLISAVTVLAVLAVAAGCSNPMAPDATSLEPSSSALAKKKSAPSDPETDPIGLYSLGWP